MPFGQVEPLPDRNVMPFALEAIIGDADRKCFRLTDRNMLGGKGVGAVPDHTIAGAFGIAGVAQVEVPGLQAPLASRLEQPPDGQVTTRLFGTYVSIPQCFDGAGGFPVEALGSIVVEVVTQIGADDDQGFVSAPDGLEHRFP